MTKIPENLSISGYSIKNNTFVKVVKKAKEDRIKVEVGDSKSVDKILPQAKISRWDNECNCSVRLIDDNTDIPQVVTEENKIKFIKDKIEAHFYDFSKVKKINQSIESDTIRYIKRGEISPESVAAEQELYKHDLSSPPTIVTSSFDREAILFFGKQDANSYYDLDTFKIPIVRLNTVFNANPMYADNNLVWLTFFYSTEQFSGNNGIELLQDSVIEALSKYNLEIKKYRGKLFYIKNGVKYKFFSSTITNERLFCYINFDTDYNKSMEWYKEGVEKDGLDSKEIEAKGLWNVNNKIKKEIVDEIVDIFVAKIGKRKKIDFFTNQEKKELHRLKFLAKDKKWRIECEREDKKVDESDGFELETVLKEKPRTNKIRMSVRTKGLKFYYQRKLTLEEKFKGNLADIKTFDECKNAGFPITDDIPAACVIDGYKEFIDN